MEYPLVFKVLFWCLLISAVCRFYSAMSGGEDEPRSAKTLYVGALESLALAIWVGYVLWGRG